MPAAQRKIEFRSVGRGRLVGFRFSHTQRLEALAHCWCLGEGRAPRQGRSSEISRRRGAVCRANQTVDAVSIGNQSLSNLASSFVELGRTELGMGSSPRGAAAMNNDEESQPVSCSFHDRRPSTNCTAGCKCKAYFASLQPRNRYVMNSPLSSDVPHGCW